MESRLARSFLPATAVLEMTYACNHACLFCSCPWEAPEGEFERKAEMDPDEWVRLIHHLGERGITSLAFTGGEPLLKRGMSDIIEAAAAMTVEHVETRDGRLVAEEGPPKLFLLSNGGPMSNEVLDLCSRHGINLSMSLPGLKTFPELTGGGDPENVLRWFRRAKDKGVGTTVNVTVTKLNLGELYETIAEGLLAGADNLLMNRFLPGGRGLANTELLLTLEEVREAIDVAERVLRESNRRGHLGTELPLCVVDPSAYTHLKVGTQCSAAKDFFVVGPSGHIRVCNHSPARLPRWTDLEAVKTHPYWHRYAMKRYLPKECSPCPSMAHCDAGCREAAHVYRGQVDGRDPLFENGCPLDAVILDRAAV
jgi:radical SAM protein with 4Fe4S-binding SPASM domain